MATGTNFYGRTTELAQLQSLFEQAATPGAGPRMVTLVAHTGVGKTRLAHEFYRWLSNHPKWDATDYWPDDLGSDKDTLRSNPELPANHLGKPLFLWWGMRAANTTDRNHADEGAMSRAASALRHLRTINENMLEKIRDQGVAEGHGMMFEGLLGPVLNLLRAGATGFEHKRARTKSTLEERNEELLSCSNELLDALRFFLHGKKIPVVVLVDDAQWIDVGSLDFLTRLWAAAGRNNWPLLVLATHWEQEWNENYLKKGRERAATLARFYGEGAGQVDGRASTLLLVNSPPADLAAWVRAELPGLTDKQVDLLVNKAGANFLQLTQNVRSLQIRPEYYFVAATTKGALTPAGERHVDNFKAEPVARATQMFQQLSTDVQSALGWSSYFGQRFLRDVAAAFAARMSVKMAVKTETEPEIALRKAVDPLAILAQASAAAASLTEFRQGAFHHAAHEHISELFGDIKVAQEEALLDVLRAWINDSFDASGERLQSAPSSKCCIALPEDEQRMLLGRMSPNGAGSEDLKTLVRAGSLALPLYLSIGSMRLARAWAECLDEHFDQVRVHLGPTSRLVLAGQLVSTQEAPAIDTGIRLLEDLRAAVASGALQMSAIPLASRPAYQAGLCTSLAAAYIRRAKVPESNARSEARTLLLQDARALLDEAKALLPYMDLTSDQRELERIRLILLASECPSRSDESAHDASDSPLGELDKAIARLRRFSNADQDLEVRQLLANALEARASSRPSQSHQAKFDDLKEAEEIRSSFESVFSNRQAVLALAVLRWELWKYGTKKAKVLTHLKLLEKIAEDKRLIALAAEGDNSSLKLLRDACTELAAVDSQPDSEGFRARGVEYGNRLSLLSEPSDSGEYPASETVVQPGRKRGFTRED
jgi:hypothetical protein